MDLELLLPLLLVLLLLLSLPQLVLQAMDP